MREYVRPPPGHDPADRHLHRADTCIGSIYVTSIAIRYQKAKG